MKLTGTLFIVGTPIGNLEDITLRAVRVLKEVDLIACEDTRVTKKLLDRFEIKTPTVSYFQHSKLSKIEYLIEQLSSGQNIALVSDAGTPGISDPGQYLINQIRIKNNPSRLGLAETDKLRIKVNNQDTRNNPPADEPKNNNSTLLRQGYAGQAIEHPPTGGDNEIKVIPIPGPSSLTAAASVSGMIEKEFYFAGFLPKKKGRQTVFKKLSLLDRPIVIYESSNRLEKTLEEIKDYLGENTTVFIGREITKMFEEYWNGSIVDVITELSNHTLKGEVVIIIQNSKFKNQN